jgi:hypothetical protein
MLTLEQLDQIEDDLRKIDEKFPNDYATAKAFELATELRPFLTQNHASGSESQSEAAQAKS